MTYLISYCAIALTFSSDGICRATLRFADTGTEGIEELQRVFAEFQVTREEILCVNLEFFAVSDRTAAAASIQAAQI